MAHVVGCGSARSVSKCLKLSFLGTASLEYQQVREVNSKHKRPEFHNLRRMKVREPTENLALRLKDKDKVTETVQKYVYTPKYQKNFRYWEERPLTITSINTLIEEFVPPEDDPSNSIVKTVSFDALVKTGKDKVAIRKIRQFEEFRVEEFKDEAKDIYIKANECLVKRDTENITDYVTVSALREMLSNMHLKTVHWKYLHSLEEPKIVRLRTNKDDVNNFAQVTLRLHSQQLLAIYDRFGRLMYGSESVPKDVLEYIVFEKNLSNTYGRWRILKKIIPKNAYLSRGQTFRPVSKDQKEPDVAADKAGSKDPENMIEMRNTKRTTREWVIAQ